MIHLSPATLKFAYKYCGRILTLSNFDFDDVKKFSTCIKANLQKNYASNKSLIEFIIHPYQGLFINFGFSGRVLYDKNGKVLPSGCMNVKGLNKEPAWIIICDARTKIHHGDCHISKESPIRYFRNRSYKHIHRMFLTSLLLLTKVGSYTIIMIFKIYFESTIMKLDVLGPML